MGRADGTCAFHFVVLKAHLFPTLPEIFIKRNPNSGIIINVNPRPQDRRGRVFTR